MLVYLILSAIWSSAIEKGICGELKKIAIQPSNVLVDYYAYRHISIVHFSVPECAVAAAFKFTVKEEKTSGIGRCSIQRVSLYLKSGSLPFVRPDGSSIEAKLMEGRRKHYSLDLQSNGDEHIIQIEAPSPGDWYAIAFRSWTDPNDGKITQQGLGATCDTVLDAELLIEEASITSLIGWNSEYEVQLNGSFSTAVIQVFVPKKSNSLMELKSSCGESCQLIVHIGASDQLAASIINDTESIIAFKPFENAFHYVTLRLLTGEGTNVSLKLSDDPLENSLQVENVNLLRKTLPEFFLFDYEHRVNSSSKSSPFNLTGDVLSVLNFEIGAVHDVGGTMTVGLKVLDENEKNKKDVVVTACISLGYYCNITDGGKCIRAQNTTTADILVNKTAVSQIHIPFPESGMWYVSMRSFCIEEKCECAKQCFNSSTCNKCDCISPCSTKVESIISSSPCIEGRCNSHGKCMYYMSGGFVFSACHCNDGYRGFDCTDGTYVLSHAGIIVRLLMLTLSNLAFIGSVYVAIRREYFTEAIVYGAVMFFSTFYHACEAGENVYRICIMRLSVLQFCDFFNALLSIWVTLVAMASFGPRLTAFCQIAGAIILAMAAEMDRTALWVFLLPAVTGVAFIGVSWGLRCRTRKTVRYPSRAYRTIYFPAGLLVVSLGLVCYAFLQTRSNYHIIHSLWHICVAVAVMLLLPKRHYMK